MLSKGGVRRGVSPVVGVILLVAITVTLAAVAAGFVLTIDVNEPPPDADFSVVEETDGDGDIERLVVTHQGGESIPEDELSVTYTGDHLGTVTRNPSDGTFSTGDTIEVEFAGSDDAGEQLNLVWSPAGSDRGELIRTHTLTAGTTG